MFRLYISDTYPRPLYVHIRVQLGRESVWSIKAVANAPCLQWGEIFGLPWEPTRERGNPQSSYINRAHFEAY